MSQDLSCRIVSLTDGEGVDHRVEARELFEDVGIRPESSEHLFQACVNEDGEVVAASTVGLYDETPDDGDPLRRPRWRFSVVVDEGWRRKGIARALVRGILDAYPRERFLLEGKVVSPHMAALLDDLGFLYDDEHEEEWSDFDRSWGRRMYLPNPSGHFLDSVESAIAWALENVGDAEDNYLDLNGEDAKLFDRAYGDGYSAAQNEKMEDAVATYVSKFHEVTSDGEATIWRAIRVPKSADPRDWIRWDCLGRYWSFVKRGAGDYGQDPEGQKRCGWSELPDEPSRVVIVEAVVPADGIDWEHGFTSFWYYGLDQFECALKAGAKIEVVSIDGVPFERAAAANPMSQENPRARPSPAQIERRAEALLEAVGDNLHEYRTLVADLKELANGGSNEFGEILNWAPGDVLMLLIAVERLRWLCVRSAGRPSRRGDSRDVRYRVYDDAQLQRLADSVGHIRNPRRRNSDADLRELEHVVKTSPRDMAAWGRLQTALRRAGAPAYQGPGYTLWLFNGLRRLTNARRVRHANRSPEVTFLGDHNGEKIEFWHGAIRVRPPRMSLTVQCRDKGLSLSINENRSDEPARHEVYRGINDGSQKPRESADAIYSAEDILQWFVEQPGMPRFEHDCSTCVFLGRHRRADLYVCPYPEHMAESVIARYSSEGSDYASSPASIVMRRIFTQPPREPETGVYHTGEDLDEAWRRARARDLFLARESRGEDLQRCRYCDGMFVPSDSLTRTHNCHAEYQARIAAARRRCARPECAETAVVGGYCRPHAPRA